MRSKLAVDATRRISPQGIEAAKLDMVAAGTTILQSAELLPHGVVCFGNKRYNTGYVRPTRDSRGYC